MYPSVPSSADGLGTTGSTTLVLIEVFMFNFESRMKVDIHMKVLQILR